MNQSLYLYSLHLADNALVLGHRNSEWTGHGPILEQDIALSNIALDLIGQARNFYQLSADIKNDGTTEDDFAYLRNADEFLNCLMVEQENGHWGKTILRQCLFSLHASAIYGNLKSSPGSGLAAVAEKSLKEVTYHVRWSSEWVIRLGQGTEESHNKMQESLNELWMFTKEMITPAAYEQEFIGDYRRLAEEWNQTALNVIERAGLRIPEDSIMKSGGKQGDHTPALSTLLKEMQHLHRANPGVEW